MNIQLSQGRVQRFLRRELVAPAYRWSGVTDPRRRQDGRSKVERNLGAALMGMLVGSPSLRDVEALTEEAPGRKLFGVEERVPDTTLYRCLKRTAPAEVRGVLVRQVRQFQRSKRLEPDDLPCGLLVVDGKCLAVLDQPDAPGHGQLQEHEQHAHYLVRALRAVLVSSRARVCVDQMMIPAATNDMGAFPAFFDQLLSAWAGNDLFEILSMDAGFASKDNAALVHAHDKGYVFGLKENQPELLAEARRILLPQHAAQKFEAATGWEKAQGHQTRRLLYRTTEMAGWLDWPHLQQVWLVVQQTRTADDGAISEELRFFVTNLTRGRLNARRCLRVVRGHWGVENDCFWAMDMIWDEERVPWCSQGDAIELLGLLRLIAFNLVQFLRQRHLRRRLTPTRFTPTPRFRQVFDWIRRSLFMEPVAACL